MKKFGIIGGLGPRSTNDFLQKFFKQCIQKNKSYRNFDFPQYLLSSQGFDYRDNKKSIEILTPFFEFLQQEQYDFWTCPCNSFHRLEKHFVEKFNIPCVSIIQETVNTIEKTDAKNLLVLSVKNEQTEQLFVKKFKEINTKKNIIALSTAENQNLRRIVLHVKGGLLSEQDIEIWNTIIQNHPNIDGIILGCTELPIFFDIFSKKYELLSPKHVFDTNEILASAVFEKTQ